MAKNRTIPFAYKLLVIVLVIVGALFAYGLFPRHAVVETVLNGDMLLLENGTLVKLIGVKTAVANDPEKQERQCGMAAADFTQNMVEGKKIRIKYHYQQNNADGRALASVYLMDGTFLNAEIIKQGYGRADAECISGDLKDFHDYERRARENKRGLWADAAIQER